MVTSPSGNLVWLLREELLTHDSTLQLPAPAKREECEREREREIERGREEERERERDIRYLSLGSKSAPQVEKSVF